jgi:hypothetical protein
VPEQQNDVYYHSPHTVASRCTTRTNLQQAENLGFTYPVFCSRISRGWLGHCERARVRYSNNVGTALVMHGVKRPDAHLFHIFYYLCIPSFKR